MDSSAVRGDKCNGVAKAFGHFVLPKFLKMRAGKNHRCGDWRKLSIRASTIDEECHFDEGTIDGSTCAANIAALHNWEQCSQLFGKS
jgi:hypothetical protein